MKLFLEILINTADILILAFVFYKILILLKNNRAMQLIKGLIFLVVLYYVSGWCHLDTVHFLLSQSWSVLLVGIVIIFQPELRSLLEHLGGKGKLLNSGTNKGPRERIISEIMRTLNAASATKTGVLMVIEGKTGLKEYINTGTVLDAAVSRELLLNIFFKNAPLHDGALIIRGKRAVAAGCIMPLSTNQELNPSCGTRHRAAVGISEVSDGLALVVSEENGGISVAKGGRLYYHITADNAEKLLREFYAGKPHKKKTDHRVRR